MFFKTSTDEIFGLKDVKPGVVVRDRRFLKRLPAIDALPGRQKDAPLTTIDGLLRHKASWAGCSLGCGSVVG